MHEMFGLDAFCGAAFVFRSERADRIKVLVWDRNGIVLVDKRLEDAKFGWPQVRDGGSAGVCSARSRTTISPSCRSISISRYRALGPAFPHHPVDQSGQGEAVVCPRAFPQLNKATPVISCGLVHERVEAPVRIFHISKGFEARGHSSWSR